MVFVVLKGVDRMTKKIIYTIISIVMIIAVLTGCHQGKETNTTLPSEENTTAITTTESASETTAESTTKADEPSTMNEATEKKTTESSTEKASTTKAQSTTTTTKKHTTTTTTTTKRVTTTQKQTTTQKPSTTHKATTTKPTTTKAATTKHKHGAPCGNMGKWYSSRNELKNDYMRVSDSWLAKYDNGEIDWDTYEKNCPCGYECWSCGECGMWTGNYKY